MKGFNVRDGLTMGRRRGDSGSKFSCQEVVEKL